MPNTAAITPPLSALLASQDGVATTAQLAAHGLSRYAVARRVRHGRWQLLLPGVVLTFSGRPARRQLVIAAWLWAGPESAVDGPDACVWHGQSPPGFDPARVHVVTPWGSGRRSRDFVVVRRSIGTITRLSSAVVSYVDLATALVIAARNASSERAAIAVLARGLQSGGVSLAALQLARTNIGDKGCGRLDAALLAVATGVRSPAEHDWARLIRSSRVLPEPLWNVWIDLGDGGPPVCLDALWPDAALAHEVNGRAYHAWGLAFDDMQRRHDRLTASGIVVMHNPPSRFRREGPAALAELERAFIRYAGRGLPPGVRLLGDHCAERAV